MSQYLLHGEWCRESPEDVRALITAPTSDVLSLDDAKSHLRVDFDDDNQTIQAAIHTAVSQLDPASGGSLGRALRPQTWELRLSGFHTRGIALPYPPLISVVSFKYDDVNGAEQTLALNTDYRILGAGTMRKQVLAPLYNQVWPSARCSPEAVRIRFTSGYPAPDPEADPVVPETLPSPILSWCKLYVGTLYENRESLTVGNREAVVELPAQVSQMISTYRVYG